MSDEPQWTIDRRLIEKAQREGLAQIVQGQLPDGQPVIVVVVTGGNVAKFRKAARHILPGIATPIDHPLLAPDV